MEHPGTAWSHPTAVGWAQLLLDSFRHWTGRELIDRMADPMVQAHMLFVAPVVIVSHGTEDDPILNYGNQLALELWETSWDELVKTPSRLTAETVNRAEREWMLEQARSRGYIENYRGVRISCNGRRFLVERATVWNVIEASGRRVGQAATFSSWTFL
jgi:hypothetical protein